MNKFFKITVVAAVTFTAAGAFAAPHRTGNEGVRLATDIVRLVDASVRFLTGNPQPIIIGQGCTPPPARHVVVHHNMPKRKPAAHHKPPQKKTPKRNNNKRR